MTVADICMQGPWDQTYKMCALNGFFVVKIFLQYHYKHVASKILVIFLVRDFGSPAGGKKYRRYTNIDSYT